MPKSKKPKLLFNNVLEDPDNRRSDDDKNIYKSSDNSEKSCTVLNSQFDIGYCEIEPTFNILLDRITNGFNEEKKKDKFCNRLFRDLTNIDRFFCGNRQKKKNILKVSTPTFSFNFGIRKPKKPLRNKKFTVNIKSSTIKNRNRGTDRKEKTKDNYNNKKNYDGKKNFSQSEREKSEGKRNLRGSTRGSDDSGDNDENDKNKKNWNAECNVDKMKGEDEEEMDDEDDDGIRVNQKENDRVFNNSELKTEMKPLSLPDISQYGKCEKKEEFELRNNTTFSDSNAINCKKINLKTRCESTESTDSEEINDGQINQQWKSSKKSSDEERVKKFLRDSPPSISITMPKKKYTLNNGSEEIKRNFNDANKKTDHDDVVIIGEIPAESKNLTTVRRYSYQPNTSHYPTEKSNRDTSKETDAENPGTFFPKIVDVQGNVSGFDTITNCYEKNVEFNNDRNKKCDSSKKKKSKKYLVNGLID
ncbi:conserved hypothetical protein [Pediculus humanus corporis]|uniref:Uncharacterized protein n=1 Tax=Pediculus humanus subsp. corporis TaxID=121224 RepID=E0VPC6_PEDHC|nr:uncharacterized protein Phum_PHUM357220 [Pediculus humanus corporis]EEB15232.1 conserved hypothetical protein [Pediculus humanus corporis]